MIHKPFKKRTKLSNGINFIRWSVKSFIILLKISSSNKSLFAKMSSLFVKMAHTFLDKFTQNPLKTEEKKNRLNRNLLSSWGGSRPVSWRHTCSECWVDWKRGDIVTGASVTLISTTKKPYSHREGERETIHCRSYTRLTSVCLSTCRYRFQETLTISVLIGWRKEWRACLAAVGSNLFQDMAMNEWDSDGTTEGKTEG